MLNEPRRTRPADTGAQQVVQFDNRFRQIKLKVVYYGPALGGKTTSLQYIHWAMDPKRRTQLYSINTANDRTIFFDLMSLSLGKIRGHQLTMQLCTVPGQVQYNATRKAVLSGVDAVVFIADSQLDQEQANIESRKNLETNLRANGVAPETIPVVYQLNKQDLPPLTPNGDLNRLINHDLAPVFPTTATTGVGVMEAFAAITSLALEAVADKLGAGYSPRALDRLQEQARRSLEPFIKAGPPGPSAIDESSVIRTETGDTVWPLPEDQLIQQAVQANFEMTDLNVSLDSVRQQLERKVEVLETIGEFGSALGSARDPEEVLERLLESTREQLGAAAGAALLFDNATLSPRRMVGMDQDPLLSFPSTMGVPLAYEIVNAKRPTLIAREATDIEPTELEYAVEEAGFTSAVAAPLVARDEVLGLVTLYGGPERLALDEEALGLAVAMVSSAGLAYANAVNWNRVENVNKDLERQVAERTSELQETIDEVQHLNADLRSQHLLLRRAYHDLEEVDRLKHELLSRISHELRTPVTSIRSAATILERYTEMAPEEGSRFVTIIREGTQRLADVIEGIVQASTLAAGTVPADKTDVPLKDFFKHAATPLMAAAEKKGVAIHVQARGGVETVFCDLDTMGPAVRAVIKNGIEFNHDGGEVKIEVASTVVDDVPWTTISVHDTGVGIPEEDLPHVSEVFWQGGDLMTEKPAGVGLGLTIATRVAEAHGGRLELQSQVDEGTVARFVIPAR